MRPCTIDEVENCLRAVTPSDNWVKQEDLLEIFAGLSKAGYTPISYIFKNPEDIDWHTSRTIEILEAWQSNPLNTTCYSLVSESLTHFGFNTEEDSALMLPVFVAAVLADAPNSLPYHNDLHFKKVLLHTVRMIAAHNYIYENTRNILAKESIAKLLIAACIHDLGHDGIGNIINRQYHFAKTEQRAFDLAKPYLEACGLDKKILSDVRIMLIGTDASPFGDPISPCQQIRRAYDYHYGDNTEEDDLELHDELSCLKENGNLALLCIILHEADLMNSVGVSYDITTQESLAISQELHTVACPEDTLLFFAKICGNEMQSGAARYLGQDNMDKIRLQLMEEYRHGNKLFA